MRRFCIPGVNPMGAPFSVFLLAENRLLREALAKILDKKSDLIVVGESACSSAAVERIAAAAPDVLIFDSYTGAAAQVQLTLDLRQRVSGLKIVMIGMGPEEQLFLQAIRQGTVGYVLKDSSTAEIVSAIRAVAAGKAFCPAELSRTLFQYVERQAQHMPNFQVRAALGLTSREQQLMMLVGRGMSNKQIACELQLAEQTVRNHVHRMLRKVGVENRFAAVEACRMQGMPV
jgi:two-component system, NarL family, response regulator DevR